MGHMKLAWAKGMHVFDVQSLGGLCKGDYSNYIGGASLNGCCQFFGDSLLNVSRYKCKKI